MDATEELIRDVQALASDPLRLIAAIENLKLKIIDKREKLKQFDVLRTEIAGLRAQLATLRAIQRTQSDTPDTEAGVSFEAIDEALRDQPNGQTIAQLAHGLLLPLTTIRSTLWRHPAEFGRLHTGVWVSRLHHPGAPHPVQKS